MPASHGAIGREREARRKRTGGRDGQRGGTNVVRCRIVSSTREAEERARRWGEVGHP